MTANCGHRCCSIATNGYHVHQQVPAMCRFCAAAAVAAGETVESLTLGRLVTAVVNHVAPQIAGLPEGQQLDELVASQCLRVYAEGLADANVQALSSREQRSVLAARVGLALAFPHL